MQTLSSRSCMRTRLLLWPVRAAVRGTNLPPRQQRRMLRAAGAA